MASEEQINNQGRLNDLLKEELEYLRESEEFLGQTISKSAQLADAIKAQVSSIKEKVTLDQKLLQFSKQNVDVLTKLKVDYNSVAKIDKDRKGILDQIQKNNNIIAAQGSSLTQEVQNQARAYVDQEKTLQDQQKALSDRIAKQEQLEALIKAQEAAGLKVDMADKALLKNAQESTRLQRMKVVGIQAELAETSKLVDPQAVSLALLQDQNTQLEEAIGYLDEEEEAVVNMEKAQGLFNTTLGAAGSILKKVGLESSALYLGLEEGRQAAENAAFELTKGGEKASTFGDRIKVLGAGIAGTFKGMANEIKAIGIGAILFKGIQGAFNMLGGKVVTGFIKDLTGKFKEGISYLKDQFFSLQSYIDDAKAGDAFLQQMSKATADIATNLGLGTAEAKELVNQASEVSREVGMMPEELAAVTGELQQAFGTTQRFSTETVKTMGELTNLFGLSNKEASEFVKLGKLSGQEAGEVVTETRAQIQALKERNNMAISEKAVMQEIAKSSALQRMNAEKFAGGIANAAFSAKKLGMEMSSVQGVADNLLNIEDSIAKEMEAELMLGKDLQLDKARQLALQGDLAGVAEEVASQIGSAEEFSKMNVMQQEALAAAVGMTKEQLAESLETRELLAGSGFDDMSKAQEEFRKLLKETGSEEEAIAAMKEKGAKGELLNQFREISLAEKRQQQERDLVTQQLKMAQATNALFDAFNGIKETILKIKGVIMTAMKPFFDSFGKTVGEGGKAFETMVLPYAKKLGEFMNDVGLRLVSIVRDNGPQIKAIFSGVLELFGSIYNVVGGVVKQLLGIKDSGASSKGFFESIKDTIAVMIEKLQNVDISALTEKVKGFIDGVKSIFKFIFEKVGAIGDFLGKNKGLTKMAGLGAFAFTMAPGVVKDIAGSVGGAIKDKAMGGLKTLGSNLGNKLTEKLGLGKLFGGGGGKKPTGSSSDPLNVVMAGGGLTGSIGDILGGDSGGLMDMLGDGKKGGGKGQTKALNKLSQKFGKFGGKLGKLTGSFGKLGGSFGKLGGSLGKLGGSLGNVGKLGGSLGKLSGSLGNVGKLGGSLGKLGGSLGKLAAGGGIGAVVGLAAEATLGHFQKKAEAAAGALDEQIAMTDDAGKAAELEQARQKKLRAAQNLEIAGTTAKYAGLGATIGSVIPGVGTAVGAAVGAVVGFTVGMVKAEKERKYQASEEAKFQANYRRLQLRNAKDRASIESNALKLKLQAEKDAAKAQLAIQQEFKSKLEGVDLNVPLDGPNAAFEDLAKKMLDAGNITEEQFTQALNGTITPLQLMNSASSKAANNLKDLYNVVGQAAAEQAGAARDAALAAQGTNAAILESEKKLIEGFANNAILLESSSKELFDQFGDQLTDGIDTYAAAALTGTDSDVGSGIADALRAQLKEETGQSAEAINAALAGVAAQLEKEGDFKLSSEQDLIKVQQMVAERLLQGVDAQALEAEKAANKAEKAGQEFGLANTKTINALTKSQLETNTELQEAIKGMEGGNEQLQAILEDGQITTAEIDAIKTFMTSAATALAGQATTDPEAAKKLEKFTDALGSATQVDDFIIRPGEAPIKFNKDDLLVGGTELDSALGIESSITSIGSKIKDAASPKEPTISLNPELKVDTSGIESSITSIGSKIGNAGQIDGDALSQILSKDLQLDKAEQATLQGDFATAAKEIANQVGSPEDFAKMNALQQEALAQAVGMSVEELSLSLKEQKEAAETSDPQSVFEKLQSQFTEQQEAITDAVGITAENMKLAFQKAEEGVENLSLPSIEAPTSMAEAVFNKIMGSEQTKEVEPDNNLVQANAELKAEVKELKEIMAGFVQQMSQVVNRPVVVELDGNKVGESIGRNSFLVQ